MAARSNNTSLSVVEEASGPVEDMDTLEVREGLRHDVVLAQARLRRGEDALDDQGNVIPEGVRNEKGQFVKGSSGNLAGRTRGVRNKITLDRLYLEDVLREVLAKQSPKLLEKAILMAMNGNDRVMRALLDKLLSTPKHDDPGEAKDNKIEVIIQSLQTKVEGGNKPTITVTPPPETQK